MTSNASKSLLLAGLLSLGSGFALAADSPDLPQASAVKMIMVTVAEDGTTVVACLGVDCGTIDCSGQDQLVSSGSPIRIRRLDEDTCETEDLTLEEVQEFDEAQLEIDDLLLSVDGDQGQSDPSTGGPDEVDNPADNDDEVNQQQVGDTGNGDSVSKTQP
jgi:hypothetical protein